MNKASKWVERIVESTLSEVEKEPLRKSGRDLIRDANEEQEIKKSILTNKSDQRGQSLPEIQKLVMNEQEFLDFEQKPRKAFFNQIMISKTNNPVV